MGSGANTNQQFNNSATLQADQSQIAQNGTNAQINQIAQNGSQLAQNQLQQGTNQNIANSTGALAATKGVTPGQVAREAGYNTASIQQNAANQGQQLQTQAQLSALGQLGANTNQQAQESLNQQQTQNSTIAGISSNAAQNASQAAGAGLSGLGAAIPLLASAAAAGGMVKPHYDQGGTVTNPTGTGIVNAGAGVGNAGLAQYNSGAAQDFQNAQNANTALNGQYANIAQNGTNLASLGLQNATNQNVSNAAAIAGNNKGLNNAMAGRQVASNLANSGQQAASQAAQLQAQTQMGAYGQLSNNQLQQQQLYLNQQQAQNAVINGLQTTVGNANLGLAESGISGLGAGLTSLNKTNNANIAAEAEGGMIHDYSSVHSHFNTLTQNATNDPSSHAGKLMRNVPTSLKDAFAKGGASKHKVPAMVSPGETYLKPSQVKQVAKGKANPLKVGERIPGKPKVAGNSYANDVVPKTLEAGGVVIPNSVMQSSDPAHNAYKFVQAVMARQKVKGK